MRIRTKLKIAALVPALMAVIIGASLVGTYVLIGRLEQKQAAAYAINDALGNLNDLVGSYALHHEERPRKQFVAAHAETTRLINGAGFDTREQQQLVRSIAQSNEQIEAMFLKVVSNYQRVSQAEHDPLLKEAEDRLVGQVLIRSREAKVKAARLAGLVSQEILTSRRWIYGLALAFMTAVAATFAVLLFGLMDSITGAMDRLQKGTEVVGHGDLAYRIGITSRDEIGRLSRAFDVMTEKLQLTTVSRDDLAVQVRERNRAARLSDALAKVNEILMSALTPDEVLARLVGEASAVAGADKCLVLKVDSDRFTITHVRDVRDDLVGQPKEASFFPAFALAAAERRPVLIGDNWRDPRTNKDFVMPYDLRAFQLLPLTSGDDVVAVIAFAYDEPKAFDAADAEFADRMATAMSLALRNARLYEREHRVAETLQQALLQMTAQPAGVESATRYVSATHEALVGGDFYDLFEVPDGRVCVVIGDVAGKGLEAATLTAMVRDSIRMSAVPGRSSGEILQSANELLCRFTSPDMFVTVFVALVDTASGATAYAGAGHPPALIVKAEGPAEMLEAGGPVLGVFSDARYSGHSRRLTGGDVLVLYTDGIIEARRHGQLFGEERLLEALGQADVREPDALLDAAFRAVTEFVDGNLADDIAMLALRLGRQGPQDHASETLGVSAIGYEGDMRDVTTHPDNEKGAG